MLEYQEQPKNKNVQFSLTFDRTSPGLFKSTFYGKGIEKGDLIVMTPLAKGYYQPYVFKVEQIEKQDVEIPERITVFDPEKLVYRIKHVPCRIESQYRNTAILTMIEAAQINGGLKVKVLR